MADVPDAFRILQAANPVTEEQLAEVRTSSALDDALEGVLRSPPPSRWWRRTPGPVLLPRARHRRRTFALVGVAVVGLAWTLYAVTKHAPASLTIGCYAAADLQSQTAVVENDGRPPTEICEELWRQGEFGPGPVPPLVPCTLSTGFVGVFPTVGSDTCARVGVGPLPDPPPSTGSPEQDPIALRDALREALAEHCIDESRAVQVATRELAARGLSDWKVEVATAFSRDKPCASFGVDVPAKLVRLIPLPKV